MDEGGHGFQLDDWWHFLKGRPRSRALTVLQSEAEAPYAIACARGNDESLGFTAWIESNLREFGFGGIKPMPPAHMAKYHNGNTTWSRWQTEYSVDRSGASLNIAAYSPSPVLKCIRNDVRLLPVPDAKYLAFDKTVENESVQSWLLNIDYGRAKAKERSQSSEKYNRTLGRLEAALSEIYDENVSFEVEFEPDPEPRLRVRGRSLNFSQLPDGVRSTIAWIADYMMREDHLLWDPRLKGKRPGLLLLDEVDAHLHPLWQRLLLPAMRKALPEVQIVATSHSPFVISSCPGAYVHVLRIDDQGRAHSQPPVDSPIGESVTTTLKEIFGVDSRFDVLTERQLNEWNDLKKREVAGSLSKQERARLDKITTILSGRSEELRSIVTSPLTIPRTILRSLSDSLAHGSEAKTARKKRA
jgi:hypothetical protein